jgi:hypothetical protein
LSKQRLIVLWGGSNEPFLNKPARFPRLDKGNAVRCGNDKALLDLLCDTLPLVSRKDADALLVNFLFQTLQLAAASNVTINVSSDSGLTKIVAFTNALISDNCDGESLTLAVAGLYYTLLGRDANYVINVHPVNQSGASSKEVSDMDIYRNGALFITNEIKDKIFNAHDVNHAVNKVIASGQNKLFFIKGLSSSLADTNTSEAEIERYWIEKDFVLCFSTIADFAKVILNLSSAAPLSDIFAFIYDKANSTKFKEKTKRHLLEVAKRFGLI